MHCKNSFYIVDSNHLLDWGFLDIFDPACGFYFLNNAFKALIFYIYIYNWLTSLKYWKKWSEQVCVSKKEKKRKENQPLFLLSPLYVCVYSPLSLFFLGFELHMIFPTNHLCFVHFYFLNFSLCTLFWSFLQFHGYFLHLITVNLFQNIVHFGIIHLSVEFPLNLFHIFYFSYHSMFHFTSISTFIRFIIA